MNKNVTALLLIILAIGIYFTYTSGKISEIKSIRAVNAEYQTAIENAAHLITVRDKVLKSYNNISESDKERLNKIIPDTVDNVSLIIDVKDDIAARHRLSLKNIKTASPDTQQQNGGVVARPVATEPAGGVANTATTKSSPASSVGQYGIVTLSFDVSTTYETFMDFLKDLESSLRITDISKLTVKANDNGTLDFSVEVRTYWLKQ